MHSLIDRRLSKLETRYFTDADRLTIAIRSVDAIADTAEELDEQVDALNLPAGCAVYLTGAAVPPVGPIRLSALAGDAEQAWFDATAGRHALVLQQDDQRLRLVMNSPATEREIYRALPDEFFMPADLVGVN